MHDDELSIAIKDAGETFEPPWPDVRAVTKRGRRRWWLARAVAVTTSLAVIGAGATVVAAVDLGEQAPVPAVAAPLQEWERIPDAPIGGRTSALTAWTGEELIVTGGLGAGNGALTDGAAYDPRAGEWEKIPPAPSAFAGRTAVWTGTELILWGGEFGDGSHLAPDTGLAFDPATREWRALPDAPYWSLAGHSAVWTGTEMIVWGGVVTNPTRAAAYDPAADEWRRIPNGPLGSRHGHEAVWTGDRMIVWGGLSQGPSPVLEGEGAEYDPATGEWTEIPEAPLEDVIDPVSFWTGEEVVVVGGLGETMASRAGAAYDPVERRWRVIEDAPVAIARGGSPTPLTDMHTTPLWTGTLAVFVTPDGILTYDPEEDRWLKPAAPRDAWRLGAASAWADDRVILWSGRTWDDAGYSRTGWSATD
ncbi:MAG TPA: hypothetical protein VEU29_00495 [Actinomycetota bacterium]|nr:hypothetical protein [Actinomycetota bacterium]